MSKTRASWPGFTQKKKKKKKRKRKKRHALCVPLRKTATLCKIEIMDSKDHS